nr:reverse transcriptase domain-containing protein [Tanacetum cinerariifolium]
MSPVTQIDTFYNSLTLRHRDTINAAAGGTFMKRRLKECYDLIKNMTIHHNDWDTSAQRSESSSSITFSSNTEITALKAEMAKINKNLMRVLQVNQQVKEVTPNYETCGGPHSFTDCPATGITTRSGTAYQGPIIPTTSSSLPPVVERETEVTKDIVHPTNNGSTKEVQPLVFQAETPILNSKPVVSPIIEPVVAPTGRALIDVFKGELTLRVGKEAIIFNLDQTSRYSANYNDMTANRIDNIDMACEEYSQEVLDSDFLLEEFDAFLALEDDVTSSEVDQSYFDPEGDIILLESFLNDDPSLPPPNQRNYLPQVRKELKICEAKTDKSSIDEPPEVELKDLPPHLKYAFWKEKSHFMVKEGIVLSHKISKNGIKVDKAKVDVIARLPHPTTVKDIRSFLGHAGFYRRFIKDFSKIARPMTCLLEKDTSFFFSKECVEAF